MSDDSAAFCKWFRHGEVLECTKCGRTVQCFEGSRDPLALCPNGSPGLGDMVAAGLSAIGITKERVSAIAGGDCGCAARQQAMNEWGKKHLGIG